MHYLKKIGRRRAGSYGRPGSRKQKRAASKGVRSLNRKIALRDINWRQVR
jgi:hypothetical protein